MWRASSFFQSVTAVLLWCVGTCERAVCADCSTPAHEKRHRKQTWLPPAAICKNCLRRHFCAGISYLERHGAESASGFWHFHHGGKFYCFLKQLPWRALPLRCPLCCYCLAADIFNLKIRGLLFCMCRIKVTSVMRLWPHWSCRPQPTSFQSLIIVLCLFYLLQNLSTMNHDRNLMK